MKPVTRACGKCSNYLDKNIGVDNVIGAVAGSVKKLSALYVGAYVCVFNKSNFQLIALVKPNKDGFYKFNGLSTTMELFVIGFDEFKKFNAVIADGVKAK